MSKRLEEVERKLADAEKRIAELEKKGDRIEYHFHSYPPVYVQPVPQPLLPLPYTQPIWAGVGNITSGLSGFQSSLNTQ